MSILYARRGRIRLYFTSRITHS
ncbi:hypothetical protein CY0110_17577 [Crocosphaera chwakensis CCY0110]|uniref:Uncharacterized protein n=1 Tax=Crocosphaera chwakensis CCY0110 TaxID=391612 RepID=A3IIJ7_9CHRO|nr:hypothetical protein CY0110_17577 [Crocosphaera chwakensis CCY0110]